ncbi:hypothetical protein TNCV_4681201 [Trichonephila clavipes]|nr:hypothetical protein TNCV_4681201 [Trichonephila clavipes]
MTAQRYVHDILQPHVLPLMQRRRRAIFEQGNARPHTARVDESRFNLNNDDNRVRVVRTRGEHLNSFFALQRHTIHTVDVMVSDAIAHNIWSPIVIDPCHQDSLGWLEHWTPNRKPWLRSNTLRVHTEYVLVKRVGPKVLWMDAAETTGTGDWIIFPSLPVPCLNCGGGVTIYRVEVQPASGSDSFRSSNNYN